MKHAVSSAVSDFFAQYPLQCFETGSIVIESYVTPRYCYYVQSGRVDQYDIGTNGDKAHLNSYGVGAFFAMSWVIAGLQNKTFFEAAMPTEVRVAPSEDVREFLRQHPDELMQLMERIVRGLDGLLMRLDVRMTGSAKRRMLFELLLFARRFGRPLHTGGYVLKMTTQELASQTGLARETVSRELSSLKESGLIVHARGTLTITDLTALEALLDDQQA